MKLALFALFTTLLACAAVRLRAPETRRVDTQIDELHGVKVADPYRWLEDEKSPEVQAWMSAQDAAARKQLGALPGREAFKARLSQLMYLDRLGAPEKRGSRLFWTRRGATQEKTVVYMREAAGGGEQVLLDPNAWSSDGSTALGSWVPSWDGKRVAYVQRPNNGDLGVLHVLDVDSMKDLEADVIPGLRFGGASWNSTSDGFFYTWSPSDPAIPVSDRPGYSEVRFHKLGTSPAGDKVWREKTGDPQRIVHAEASKDGHWLILEVSVGSSASNDLYVRDLRLGEGGPWVALVVGKPAHYTADVYRDRLYLWTDEGAPRGRAFSIDPQHPAREGWKEIIAEHPRDVLHGITVVGGKLGVSWLQDVASRLEVRSLDGALLREQPLPARGTASPLVGDEDDDDAYFSFTSFTTPTEIHKTSVATGQTSLYFRLQAPVDGTQVEAKQLFFNSKDGTRIPLWVMHKKGLVLDGKAPTILYGYGGFLISLQPGFNPEAFAWIEQGGVYAVANLRGGGEYGEQWHKAGMMANKQNVFDDYFAAAEYLIAERYTSKGRLAAEGGSNGGLLVGAALTQRPDLFGVALCAVPLLDMIRYPRFGVAKFWVPEYGDPEDAAQFKTLYSYSPYHQVKEGTRYPATVIFSADSDDRVDPMHARKMAAALQRASSGGPVLLRIERHAGHGGADLIRASVERLADALAFARAYLGKVD